MLRPLPFAEPDRLVQVAEKNDKLRVPQEYLKRAEAPYNNCRASIAARFAWTSPTYGRDTLPL